MKPSEIFEGEGSSLHQAYVEATSTNQEIKNQAHKDFSEIEVSLTNHIKDDIKFFIDSIIDRTVQSEQERIEEVLEIAQGRQYPYQDDRERLDIIIEKLSLITNKSSIDNL